MFAQLYQDLPGILLLPVLLVWAAAAALAGRRSRWALVCCAAGAALVVARVVMAAALWRAYSWDAVALQVSAELPLLVAPLVAVTLLSVPRLLRREAERDRAMMIPLRSAVAGAVLDADVVLFPQPSLSFGGHVLRYVAPLVLVTALLWRRHGRTASWRVRGAVATGTAVLLAGTFAYGASASRLPERMSMATGHAMDHGGGPAPGHHGAPVRPRSVTALTGPRTGRPDRAFTLTARASRQRLTSGAEIDALTFDGRAPGPELRVRRGDLVQVTLVNRLAAERVTLHWHGLDVPNAEDGVAGLTQDAVTPGGSHTYRFRAEQAGTYWYHTHQASSKAVKRGLFGALIVEPPVPDGALDLAVLAHAWPTSRGVRPAFGLADTRQERRIAPGTRVRLRLINTGDNTAREDRPTTFSLAGTPFRVTAIDGVDVAGPAELTGVRLGLATGGRYDLGFTMPDRPVLLSDVADPGAGLLFTPRGTGAAPATADGPFFDPAAYGTPAPTPFGRHSRFDRRFRVVMSSAAGFFDGRPNLWNTLNGKLFPHIPTLVVSEGDLVRTTLVNRTGDTHPMHLHGHHALVLSRDGKAVSGSPWWTDSLDVGPGRTYEIAFRAANPGLWMDHCHNLDHAAEGMAMHLAYTGVTTPYLVGRGTPNQPE